MKAKFFSLGKKESGATWPSSSRSLGLLLSSSNWLGPPAMNRKMTFLALGVNSGWETEVAAWLFPEPSMFARAMDPRPSPESLKKCLRVRERTKSFSASASLFFSSAFMGDYSRVINSSVFIRALVTAVHEAAAALLYPAGVFDGAIILAASGFLLKRLFWSF